MELRGKFLVFILLVAVIMGCGAWLIDADRTRAEEENSKIELPWREDKASLATLIQNGTAGQITYSQLDEEFLHDERQRNDRLNSVRATNAESDPRATQALIDLLEQENAMVRALQTFNRVEKDLIIQKDSDRTLDTYDMTGYLATRRANDQRDLNLRRQEAATRVIDSLKQAEMAEDSLKSVFARKGISFVSSIRSSDEAIRSWVDQH
jgi:hypothetical protein